MGDPCGIGPEIVLKALKSPAIRNIANFVIIGDSGVFERTARQLSMPMKYVTISHISEADDSQLPVSILSTDDFKPGIMRRKRATAEGGELSVQCVIKGINLAMSGHIDALVTAPICKEAIHLGGYGYPGHTEMLHTFSGAERVVMLMVGGKLRVAFATTHIAIKDVPQSITVEDILRTIIITDNGIKQYFGIKKPKIAVCGLNPHAGEEGIFGQEEKKIIAPAVRAATRMGIRAQGPLPADSLFHHAARGDYDAVVCMYHDQGLIPLKLHHFFGGVALTLGPPFIRTSVDHGTAYDIAGKGKADPTSMKEAILLAARLARRNGKRRGK